MWRWLLAGLALSSSTKAVGSLGVVLDRDPVLAYAIGDVHGRLDLLERLEAEILSDAEGVAGEKDLIHLGDHIDRGPDSAGVLRHLLSPLPESWTRVALAGNHELAMLDFLRRPSLRAPWLLGFEGLKTLRCYGVRTDLQYLEGLKPRQWRELLDYFIPREHIELLEAMPLYVETPTTLYVHAGLDPSRPIAGQGGTTLTGFTDGYAETFEQVGKCVVHGHQIREAPLVTAHRIAVDTGAYASGVLSAVRLAPGEAPRILFAQAET